MPFQQKPNNKFKVVVLLLVSLPLLFACSESNLEEDTQTIRPVRTAVVSEAASAIQRTYPAVVLPAQVADLAFKVSGRIIELPIRASTQVSEGQVIAQLDRREYESAVTQLESQLEQASAQLTALTTGARSEDIAALEAKVKAAQAQLATQTKQVNRLRQLADKGTIARVDLEKEIAKLAADKSNVDVAEQELKKAQAGAREEEVEAQEAVIRGLSNQLDEAKADLEDTTLRAPFDGVIASRKVENFTNIQANTTVATLQQLNTIDLQFDVPGSDVAILGKYKGNLIRARLDAAPGQAYEASLVEFGTQADAATQTFRGRVSISYPEDVVVLPGMTGNVTVKAQVDESNELRVPESALAAAADGTSFIWVVDPSTNSVSKRVVTPNTLSGDYVAISGDIQSGDRVVTAGVSFLREGMIVKPMTVDSE